MGYNAKDMNGLVRWHANEPEEGLEEGCGGTRVLHCFCGGDFCCCGNNGEVECYGCEDCEGDEDYLDRDYPEENDSPSIS